MRCLSAGMLLAALAGCGHQVLTDPAGRHGVTAHDGGSPLAAGAPSGTVSSWDQQVVDGREGAASGRWEHYTLPGKTPARFVVTRKDGRDALAVASESAASLKRMNLQVPPDDLGRLRFSWNVPALIDKADMARADLDDSAVRVVLVFEGDRRRFSARNAMLSELSRALTGEELPYATMMYVWCNKRPAGEVIVNPRTDRIRKIVVESGSDRLGRWVDYERDIRADFERAFGEAPGALIAVALMTDTDNTRARARAWYGPLRLEPR